MVQTYEEQYGELKNVFERSLNKSIMPGNRPHELLIEAMNYSLLDGGKRVRPVMTMAFCKAAGGGVMQALPAAKAVEMIHCYSLIHDDMPFMDNDSTRRGKATNHVIYGDATAALAGDALQARAFYEITISPLSDSVKVQCLRELSKAAGEEGMCAGQFLDLSPGYGLDEEQIRIIHSYKTAAIIKAACVMGVICGGGSREQISAALIYAEKVGAAFQIVDDILDATGDPETLGKDIKSDERSGKPTFYSLLGEAKCKRSVVQLTVEARAAVMGKFQDHLFLESMADKLAKRKH